LNAKEHWSNVKLKRTKHERQEGLSHSLCYVWDERTRFLLLCTAGQPGCAA
jgi:hypothetical protein